MNRAIRSLAVIAVTGCGRLHFDPLGGDDGGAGADADIPCSPFDITFAAAHGELVAWTGNRYVLVAQDMTTTEYRLQELRPDGTLGVANPIGSSLDAVSHLVWNGSELDVVFDDSNGVWLLRAGPDGTPMGPPVALAPGSTTGLGHAAWSGNHLGVVWVDQSTSYFREFAADGTASSLPIMLPFNVGAIVPASVGYMLVGDTSAPKAVLIDRTSSYAMTTHALGVPAGFGDFWIVPSPSGYGVLRNVSPFNPSFMTLAPDGSPTAAAVMVPVAPGNSYAPLALLATYGSNFLVGATGDHPPVDLTMGQLDATGAVVQPVTAFTTLTPANAGPIALVASTGRVLFVFHFQANGNDDVRAIQLCL